MGPFETEGCVVMKPPCWNAMINVYSMPLQSRKNATCTKLRGVEVENIKCNDGFVYKGLPA